VRELAHALFDGRFVITMAVRLIETALGTMEGARSSPYGFGPSYQFL
jgi:hypothetical protein